MNWFPKSKLLSGIIVICTLLTFSFQVKAKKVTLQQAIEWGVDHNSTLRELRYNANKLQRKLNKLKAKMSWQVNLSGQTNYRRETVKEANRLGVIEENIEKQKQVTLNLQGDRLFGWGLNLNPTLSFNQQKLKDESFDFDKLEDKMEADLTLTQKLYPWIPPELEREYYSVKIELQRAKDKLSWQREQKKIDWIAKYLHLLRLQQKKKLADVNYELAKQNLEQVKHQKEIEEAGIKQVLTAKVRVKETKSDLVKVKNDFKQTQREWLQELGYTEDREIILTKANSYLKKLKKKTNDLNIADKKQNCLIDKVKEAHPDTKYNQRKRQLAVKQLKWKQAEERPEFELMGNYDYQSEDWKVGISIDYNLFDSGHQKLAVKDHRQQLTKLKKDYQNLVKDLEVQLNNLLNQLFQAKLKFREAKVKLEKLKVETELFEKQLQAGGIVKDRFKQKRNEFRQAKVNVQIRRDKILINNLKLMQFLNEDILMNKS